MHALYLRVYQVLNAGNFDNNGIEKIFRAEFSLITLEKEKSVGQLEAIFGILTETFGLSALLF